MKFAILALLILMSCTSRNNTLEAEEVAVNDGQKNEMETSIIAYHKNPRNLNDVANYTPVSFSRVDTLEGYQNDDSIAFRLTHTYKATNYKSEEITREVDVYLDKNKNIVSVQKKQ